MSRPRRSLDGAGVVEGGAGGDVPGRGAAATRLVRAPARFAEKRYDLIVVGGGIHGACLHLEASRAGLRTLLLERDDFGGGTSANSLRILHGGLRYLQRLDVRRFRQSVRERAWFMRNFPEHVRPLPCLMPLYGVGLKRRPILGMALALNDLLSADRNRGLPASLHLPRGRLLDVEATSERFPAVRRAGLRGAALWYDGVMERPARILIEILRAAAALGGDAINYLHVSKVEAEGGAVVGVVGREETSGRSFRFEAPRVALCVGPDTTLLNRSDVPEASIPPRSLAFNLVLRRPLPSDVAVAVSPPAPDGQVLFLHSVGDVTLAGTIHAPWRGSLPRDADDPLVLSAIDKLNRSCRGWKLGPDDVADVLAGVLPTGTAGSAELASRERITDHGATEGPRGLYSIVGIKYTTSRSVAEQALALIAPEIRDRGRSSLTGVVSSGWIPPSLDEFLDQCREDPVVARGAVERMIREEAVLTPEDFVHRRMDWGPDPGRTKAAMDIVGEIME